TQASESGGMMPISPASALALAGAASGVFSTADNTGNAGRIAVTAPSLVMSDGAKISVNTQGAGAAGDITLNLSTLTLAGSARIDSGTSGSGHGGDVTIAAPASVNISGAAVSSNATAGGAGGNITISTADMAVTKHGTISGTSAQAGN